MEIPCARRAGEYQQMLECGSKRESKREFVDIKCERNLESAAGDAILLFVKRM